MELKNLRAFVEVIRQNGFTAAGKTLNATQSTVSKAVRQLESRDRRAAARPPGGETAPDAHRRGGLRPRAAPAGRARRPAGGNRRIARAQARRAAAGPAAGRQRHIVRAAVRPIPQALSRRRHQAGEHGSARLEEILRLGEIDFAASLLPVDEDFEWHEIRRDP